MLDVLLGCGIVKANSTYFVNYANVEAIESLVLLLFKIRGCTPYGNQHDSGAPILRYQTRGIFKSRAGAETVRYYHMLLTTSIYLVSYDVLPAIRIDQSN